MAWSLEFRGDDTARFDALKVLPSEKSSAQWRATPLQIREASFFSARCNDARLLGEMQNYISRAARGESGFTRLDFVKKMRTLMGIPPEKTKEAGKLITEMTSFQRLNLIFEFWTRRINAREAYLRSLSRIDYFPVQEFLRTQRRKEPREWGKRWREAGGKMIGTVGEYGGRMIAPLGSEIWTRISAFDTPFPPFDFNSGMGLKPIARAEAQELGFNVSELSKKNASGKISSENVCVGAEASIPKIPRAIFARGDALTAKTEKGAERKLKRREGAIVAQGKAIAIRARAIDALRRDLGDSVCVPDEAQNGGTAVFIGQCGRAAGKVYDAAVAAGAQRATIEGVSPSICASARIRNEALAGNINEFKFKVSEETREDFKLSVFLSLYPQIVRVRNAGGILFGRKIGGKWFWAMAEALTRSALLLQILKR